LLRQALRLRTTPAPIAPLPIPPEAGGETKPDAAAAVVGKPSAPDAAATVAAAVGD